MKLSKSAPIRMLSIAVGVMCGIAGFSWVDPRQPYAAVVAGLFGGALAELAVRTAARMILGSTPPR